MSSIDTVSEVEEKPTAEPIDPAFVSYHEKVEHFRKFESMREVWCTTSGVLNLSDLQSKLSATKGISVGLDQSQSTAL